MRTLLALLLFGPLASCGPAADAPAPPTPAVATSDLPGSWIGAMRRGRTMERAMLKVDWVLPASGNDRFAYRIDFAQLVEQGVGSVWVEDADRLRLCFSDRACGTAFRRDGELRIVSSVLEKGEPRWHFRSSR